MICIINQVVSITVVYYYGMADMQVSTVDYVIKVDLAAPWFRGRVSMSHSDTICTVFVPLIFPKQSLFPRYRNQCLIFF